MISKRTHTTLVLKKQVKEAHRATGSRKQKNAEQKDERAQFRVLETAVGPVGIVATGRGLRRVYLPEESTAGLRRAIAREFPLAAEQRDLLPELCGQIERYFRGEPVNFDVEFDWSGYGQFDMTTWRHCKRIGYGRTGTYAQLAERAGKPRAARAVGMAMGRNPCPIVVPCHRVLRSDGSLGGYSGRLGIAFKQRLLEMEAAAGLPS